LEVVARTRSPSRDLSTTAAEYDVTVKYEITTVMKTVADQAARVIEKPETLASVADHTNVALMEAEIYTDFRVTEAPQAVVRVTQERDGSGESSAAMGLGVWRIGLGVVVAMFGAQLLL
jgi:hypothetical protein